MTPKMPEEVSMSDEEIKSIREITLSDNTRVEDGPVRFIHEDGYKDWAGTFLRGDSSFHYAMHLRYLLNYLERNPELMTNEPSLMLSKMMLEWLLNLLSSSQES